MSNSFDKPVERTVAKPISFELPIQTCSALDMIAKTRKRSVIQKGKIGAEGKPKPILKTAMKKNVDAAAIRNKCATTNKQQHSGAHVPTTSQLSTRKNVAKPNNLKLKAVKSKNEKVSNEKQRAMYDWLQSFIVSSSIKSEVKTALTSAISTSDDSRRELQHADDDLDLRHYIRQIKNIAMELKRKLPKQILPSPKKLVENNGTFQNNDMGNLIEKMSNVTVEERKDEGPPMQHDIQQVKVTNETEMMDLSEENLINTFSALRMNNEKK